MSRQVQKNGSYALPPFESETYRGYQESNEIEVELEDGTLTGQQLTLTASNVAGRHVFKEAVRSMSKLVPLGGVFLAFSDEDGI